MKRRIIGIICLIVAVGIMCYLIYDQYSRNKSQQAIDDLKVEEPVEEEPEEEDSIIPAPPFKSWEEQWEINEDIYAWIYLPEQDSQGNPTGARVNHPILQHETDDGYYLHHDIEGNESAYGSVYTEKAYNSKDFNDTVTILYGHNMKNLDMFGSLKEYREEEYYNNNRYMFIYTPEKYFAYEIFCAREVDDRHFLYGWDFSQPGTLEFYEETFNEIATAGNYDENMTFTDDDKVIILATCATAQGDDRRFLVQGKLVETKEVK